MKIEPRIGLDDIRFGMNREEVQAALSEPDNTTTTEHGENDTTESWYFVEMGCAFHFEEECDWRLKTMEATSPEAMLKGTKIVGQSMQEVRKLLRKKRVTWGEEESDDGLFYCEAWDMNLWFRDGVIESVQWEVRLDDNDEYLWPE